MREVVIRALHHESGFRPDRDDFEIKALELDEWEMWDVMFDIEQELGIQLDEDTFNKQKTLGDLVAYVESKT